MNGEGAHVIQEAACGWSFPAGHVDALAGLVIDLLMGGMIKAVGYAAMRL